MRGSVRQLLLPLLAATYAVLWTCGSAWHLASCTHCDHAADASCSHDAAHEHPGCCQTHSGTRHCSSAGPHDHDHKNDAPAPSSEQPSDTPEYPHDSTECEVCQLFAQPLVFAALSTIEVSRELVEIFACSLPLEVPECELIPATSRGPPAV